MALCARLSRETLLAMAEVCACHVHPLRWGTGVGQLLMTAARERLRRAAFAEVTLWVLEGNLLARRFYELDGWTHDGGRRTDTIGDTVVEQVRYRRPLP